MPRFQPKPEKKIQPVITLTEKNYRGLVIFRDEAGTQELGRIKDFDNDRNIAWVVFRADGQWGDRKWLDYTAEACDYRKLTLLLK